MFLLIWGQIFPLGGLLEFIVLSYHIHLLVCCAELVEHLLIHFLILHPIDHPEVVSLLDRMSLSCTIQNRLLVLGLLMHIHKILDVTNVCESHCRISLKISEILLWTDLDAQISHVIIVILIIYNIVDLNWWVITLKLLHSLRFLNAICLMIVGYTNILQKLQLS